MATTPRSTLRPKSFRKLRTISQCYVASRSDRTAANRLWRIQHADALEPQTGLCCVMHFVKESESLNGKTALPLKAKVIICLHNLNMKICLLQASI